MARTAVIAQARMGSSRLPGKVLKQLGDRTVLAHVIWRAQAIQGADDVCIATSDLVEDDVIAAEAERCGAAVYRGDETDVLARYIGAARMLQAQTIMRITCDCPLIDPAVCRQVLGLLSRANVDYASNIGEAQWPHGLDCEAFSIELLERAGLEGIAADEREHVTLWMRRNQSVRKAELEGPGAPASQQRWTLDYAEDMELLRVLVRHLPPPPATPGWREVLDVILAYPDLVQINQIRNADKNARVGIVGSNSKAAMADAPNNTKRRLD